MLQTLHLKRQKHSASHLKSCNPIRGTPSSTAWAMAKHNVIPPICQGHTTSSSQAARPLSCCRATSRLCRGLTSQQLTLRILWPILLTFFSLTEPLSPTPPQPHPTPRNGPNTDPKRTRNGPKQTQTDPNGPETDRNGPKMDRNQALRGGTAGGFVGMGGGWGL